MSVRRSLALSVGSAARASGVELSLAARLALAKVLWAHGMSMRSLTDRSRVKPIVRARQSAMRAARAAQPDLTLQAIGRLFNRTHATVLYALRGCPRRHPTVRPC